MIRCSTILKGEFKLDSSNAENATWLAMTGTKEVSFNALGIDTYNVYFSDDTTYDLLEKQELEVLATTFRRTNVITQKLRDLRVGQEFSGLQLLCKLPDGKMISVGVNPTSRKGLFKYINDITLGIEVPIVTNDDGNPMYDYRELYNNDAFMEKLIEKLILLDNNKGKLRLQISKGHDVPETDRTTMESKIYPPKSI